MSSPNSSAFLESLFGLRDRTAVVIGGTGTLGRVIAKTFAQAGAHVIVIGLNALGGRDSVDEILEVGGTAEFLAADATRARDLEQVVTHLETAGRRADILVNGAGINSSTPFLDISDEEWDRILNINLRSVRLSCQIFGRHLLNLQAPGSIINIASMSAITPLSRVFTYSVSKAAVLNLTQNLAREWATKGIRVNAISPGFFPAEQNRKVLTPDRVASILNHTPMNRFGSPEELAGAALMLASSRAGSFVTGSNVVVDGGFSAMSI